MMNRLDRKVSFFIIALLLISSIMMLIPDNGGSISETPTRASSGFISKENFYLHTEYNRDNLWVVVWMENKDTIYQPVTGTDRYYNFREVANSFAFPVNGGVHNSGPDRRALVELFTATDCGYCPGSEGALDTLAKERFPDDFSLIEWHRALNPGNDPYETGSSQGRFGSYNVTGTPAVVFDGMVAQIGGDQNPSNTQLPKDYGQKIDNANKERPLVSFSGQSDYGGDYLWFNVTFDVINPMPLGNWSIKAAVCEDLQKEHSGAIMRHTPRGSVLTKQLTDLQEGFPNIFLDEERIFEVEDRDHVKDDLTIYWSASDIEDGSALDIDVIYREKGGQWETLAPDLSNTGSYVWDTLDPRIPDGQYQIRLIATDSDDNTILSGRFIGFTIDNLDFPAGNFTFPMSGDSIKGRDTIRWNSDDDEDGSTGILFRLSIRNSTEEEWRIITYNQVTGDDWIVNQNSFELNTLNYEDLPTYQLKLDLLDTDEMMTTIISDQFEIYNNDAPRSFIFSPEDEDMISQTLNIGWKVTDEEDLPSGIYGNFSVQKDGQVKWTILWEGLLDDAMENKTFDTTDLFGDGDYTLKFTITDSRGLMHSTTRLFSVFDPDTPVFTSISGPEQLTDIRSQSITISWECSDADEGESITYSVYMSPSNEENWTALTQDLTFSSFKVMLDGKDEGSYRLKVVAKDPTGLESEVSFGPFFYNAPDAPELFSISHEDGLTGDFPENNTETLADGSYFMEIIWNSRDADGDNVTYSLYYRKVGAEDWTPLVESTTQGFFEWNMTALKSGDYQIRIVALDNSDSTLSSEIVQGPFTWYNVFTDIEDDKPGNGGTGTDGDETDDDINVGLIVLIAVGSIILIVLIVLLSLFVVSSLSKRSKETDVIPDQSTMDYNAIPEFDRMAPVAPATPPQPVQSGQVQPVPIQMSPEAVNWEEEETQTFTEGSEQQQIGGQPQGSPEVHLPETEPPQEEAPAVEEPPVEEVVDNGASSGISGPPPPPV